MAFSVVPTPLWTLYQARDRFSTFDITVAFAAYAVGVLVSLFLAGHLSDRVGRRTILVPAILIEVLAAVLFLIWNDLTGLIVARVVSGLGIGMITATATAHIFELHTRAHPAAGRGRSDLVSTAANLGGFAVGALASGLLAQYVMAPLATPYIVFLVLLLLAALGLAFVPETIPARSDDAPYRPQRVRVPRESRGRYFAAAAVAFGAFALLGLFTSLAPVFVAGDLHITNRAIAGLIVFLTFGSAASVQMLLGRAGSTVQVSWGVAMMIVGLASLTTGVFESSLALFVVGGLLAGGAAGLLFKNALSIGSGLAEPVFRGEALAGLFLFGYLGLAVPVLGIGIATLSVPLTTALVWFAIVTSLVVLVGGFALIRGNGHAGLTRHQD
jgi:Major Facilitator Superfamily